MPCGQELELWAGSDEGFACIVVGELDKVVDEELGKVLGFLVPFRRIGVGVARIENCGVDTGKCCGHLEVEIGHFLGGCLLDGTVKYGVDDAACVFDRDAFAGAVPASVDEIGLCSAAFHTFHELFGVLGGMQLEECLSEAGAEGRRGLGNAAFGTSKLGRETAEEVILALFGSEDADGRQHTVCVGAEEDDVLGCRSCADGANYLFDMVDGIADAGVFGDGFVFEVDFAVVVDGDVLEECIATDGVVDVGFAVFVEVDDLGVAAAFEVEDAVVVPSVFVVADEETLGIGREGGLAGAAETEEDGRVLAFHIGVGRAVHRGDTFERKVVVHHREHTFLHLATVPGVEDYLLAA